MSAVSQAWKDIRYLASLVHGLVALDEYLGEEPRSTGCCRTLRLALPSCKQRSSASASRSFEKKPPGCGRKLDEIRGEMR
jgi:hypothetical protein